MLDVSREDISDTARGPDQRRGAWVFLQLSPEAQNLHVDRPVEYVLMHASGLEQLLPRERFSGRIDECGKQGELAFRQADRSSGRTCQAAAPMIQHPPMKVIPASPTSPIRPRRCRHAPAQYCPSPCHQFSQADRSGDAVIRAEFQAHDAINLIRARIGDDDHGGHGLRTDKPEGLISFLLPDFKIEDQQIGSRGR